MHGKRNFFFLKIQLKAYQHELKSAMTDDVKNPAPEARAHNDLHVSFLSFILKRWV